MIAAGYSAVSVAAGSYVSVFGANLSSMTVQASGLPYPKTLGNTSVTVAGEQCQLTYVSPGQINFLVPSDMPPGRYLLSVGTATSELIVTSVAPGIFTLNGSGTGVPLAQVIGVLSDGTNVSLPPYTCASNGCSIVPISFPDNMTDLYVVLYGTGFKSLHNATAAVGSTLADVVYTGSVGQYPGLDQMNLHVRNFNALSGLQQIQITADGVPSNTVTLQFQ